MVLGGELAVGPADSDCGRSLRNLSQLIERHLVGAFQFVNDVRHDVVAECFPLLGSQHVGVPVKVYMGSPNSSVSRPPRRCWLSQRVSIWIQNAPGRMHRALAPEGAAKRK